jgi:hypothetical protein
MKHQSKMPRRCCSAIHLLLVLALCVTPVAADVVYVTARPSPSGAGPNLDGTYSEVNITLGDTGAIASAPGRPTTSGARAWLWSTNLTSPSAGFNLTATLGVPGAIYQIYHNFSSLGGNTTTNVVLAATCSSGGTLDFNNTMKFQRSYGNPADQWQFLGFLTNAVGSATPTIQFRYQSGLVNSTLGNRLLVDCFRFTLYEPCSTVAVPLVIGPLATNLPVTVTGVSASATNVAVYQDSGRGMVKLGEVTVINAGPTVVVSVPGLVKGAQVSATQTINNQESCVQTTGSIVGGGANPRMGIAFSIREAPGASGPAGANGRDWMTNNIHFLGPSSVLLPGYGPGSGTLVVYPSNTWQTVTLQRGPNPTTPVNTCVQWYPTVGTLNNLQGKWGVLEALAISIDDLTDTGPFDIYIDNIANGTNGVFQSFEGVPVGTVGHAFNLPLYSGTTKPFLLVSPDEAEVSNDAADPGDTNSLRVQFQFGGTSALNWVRLTTYSTNNTAGFNPLVNLDEPISVPLLLQPVASLPVPWRDHDVGSVGAAGSANYSGGTFTVTGSGEDIVGTADGFHFVRQTLSGDGQVIARLLTLGDSDPLAEAGVMMRDGLFAEGAKHVFVAVDRNSQANFCRRLQPNAYSFVNSLPNGTNAAPAWLRLMRMGDTFVGHYSTNGGNWELLWFTTITMSSQVQVGLAVTAHYYGALNTATFDNVNVSGLTPVPGYWPRPVIYLGGERLGLIGPDISTGFKMLIGGNAGERYAVEASTVLGVWSDAGIVTNLYGVVDFLDTTTPSHNAQFYRIRVFTP